MSLPPAKPRPQRTPPPPGSIRPATALEALLGSPATARLLLTLLLDLDRARLGPDFGTRTMGPISGLPRSDTGPPRAGARTRSVADTRAATRHPETIIGIIGNPR